MVPMFAKMVDIITDDFLEQTNAGLAIGQERIPALLFMDDVLSIAEGYEQQIAALEIVNEFGLKHQLEWGIEKCKVMELGADKRQKKVWNLGKEVIENCDTYKYLGELIYSNGRNDENLAARFKKVKNTVRAINTRGIRNIKKRIEIDVFIKLPLGA